MNWIFLSPHFDDAALSCGGLIYEFACAARLGEETLIFTICAGEPPPGPLPTFAQTLHERWHTSLETVRERRAEDEAATKRLGASTRYYTLPDCIYRRLPGTDEPLIQKEADLFMPLPDGEVPTAVELAEFLAAQLPRGSAVVSPLTIGGHVDHRLVHQAAEMLTGRRPDLRLWYYADYPYAALHPQEVDALKTAGWQPAGGGFTPEAINAWVASVAEYRSQISTFWKDEAEMAAAITDYARQGGRLWLPPK